MDDEASGDRPLHLNFSFRLPAARALPLCLGLSTGAIANFFNNCL
jgi:hypothetical protein